MYRWISQEKIIPKPKIFTGTRTQYSDRVCVFSSCNNLAETILFFALFYYRA
jgi:hypothetical protein